jgi:hypothetical protein
MSNEREQATKLRRAELMVLVIGMLIALSAMLFGARGAFQANMAWTEGTETVLAFLLTLASLLIVGVIVVAPYALLFFLGKRVPKDGSAISFQIAGLVISSLSTVATVYLYYLALDAVHSAKGSTTALVFVVTPAYLFLANALLYGVTVLVHAHTSKKSRN